MASPNKQPAPRRTRRDRPEKGLPRWLELAVAVTALVTSVSSIVIAVQGGKTMDRLVKANSVPYLSAGFSDITPQQQEILSLDLVNAGVGPAHQESLRVKVDGRYVRSTSDLIAATLGPTMTQQFAGKVIKNGVRTRFIPGGRTQPVFQIPKNASDAAAWEPLSKAMDRWTIDYCYCSVFDECWQVQSKWAEPQPVRECRRDEPHEFMP